MIRLRRHRHEPMPEEFQKLAVYNAEVARGLVHTDEWKAGMAYLQERYNEWLQIRYGQQGGDRA